MLYWAVGLAGGLGAMLRYGLGRASIHLGWVGFPYVTILVNVLGSFLIGYAALTLQHKWGVSDEIKTVFTVGFLGGFTTFSAFSLEVIMMIERGDTLKALSYVFLTIACCMIACSLGLAMAKSSL